MSILTKILPGRIVKVKNKDRPKFTNAATEYYAVWVSDQDGKNERCLLLTDSDLKRLEYRSFRNREDWTKPSFLASLFKPVF